MRHVLIGIGALIAASLAGTATASAQHWYGKGTWCIQPPIGGGSWECTYYSQAQCRASLGDIGASSCVPSPAAEWARREGRPVKQPVRRRQDR